MEQLQFAADYGHAVDTFCMSVLVFGFAMERKKR